MNDDFFQEQKMCPDCNGSGYVKSGIGHFGDQNGDAGEWKNVRRSCFRCDGFGRVDILPQEWEAQPVVLPGL